MAPKTRNVHNRGCPVPPLSEYLATGPPPPAVRCTPLDSGQGVSRAARDLQNHQARESPADKKIIIERKAFEQKRAVREMERDGIARTCNSGGVSLIAPDGVPQRTSWVLQLREQFCRWTTRARK